MRSEIQTARNPALSHHALEETCALIFEGAKRELKFRQAAMISQRLTHTAQRVYLHSRVEVFARGRGFVIGACAVLLFTVCAAIYTATDNWSERLEQLQSVLLVLVFAVPAAYAYLHIEKSIRHHRLHQKIEQKLQELILTSAARDTP